MRRFFFQLLGLWTDNDEWKWRMESLTAAEWFETASNEELRKYRSDFLDMDMDDAFYVRHYGGDTEAIAQAKRDWREAGEKALHGIPTGQN